MSSCDCRRWLYRTGICIHVCFLWLSGDSNLKGYPELLTREEPCIAASVKETLEKKGIVFRMNAKVQSVNHTSEKAIVAFTDLQTNEAFELEADAVLLATGRRPNTQGLHLEAAGVEVDARGAIIVDEYLKTTNPAIRAVVM